MSRVVRRTSPPRARLVALAVVLALVAFGTAFAVARAARSPGPEAQATPVAGLDGARPESAEPEVAGLGPADPLPRLASTPTPAPTRTTTPEPTATPPPTATATPGPITPPADVGGGGGGGGDAGGGGGGDAGGGGGGAGGGGGG